MTGLCRVCDCALLDTDTAFVESHDPHAIFRVQCSSCGSLYLTDEHGDLLHAQPFQED